MPIRWRKIIFNEVLLLILDVFVLLETLLCVCSIYKIRTISVAYKTCSVRIQEAFDMYENGQAHNPIYPQPPNQDIITLFPAINQAEYQRALDVTACLFKLPLDIIAFVCLVLILVLNHRYILGHKLYELNHNRKAEVGLGLFSTEDMLRKKISKTDPQFRSESILEPHQMIARQAVGGVVDLLFIVLFVLQVISPWRMVMTVGTCARFLNEIREIPYSQQNIRENETRVYDRMGLIRGECFKNLLMSMIDLIGFAIIIASLAAVWRIYYQVFIIKTVRTKPHKEIAKTLGVVESHHRLNMLVAAEFRFVGSILVDLIFAPFALIDAIAFWNYGKLYHWMKSSKHDDFQEHRSIIFYIFVETMSQVLVVLCWVFGFTTILRISTFLRFMKIIEKEKNDMHAFKKYIEGNYKKLRELAVSGKPKSVLMGDI